MRKLPFSVDNPESDVFVGRSSAEVQKNSLIVAWLLDNFICRSFTLVDKIWIEYVEL